MYSFRDCNSTSESRLAYVQDDFDRDVWCLFGLPVDRLSMMDTSSIVDQCVATGEKKILSTLNVNWVSMAQQDEVFRAAVIDSDICTLDGMPLLWAAWLAGYPLRDLVQGSSLVEFLMNGRRSAKPLSIFLYGGDPGVAKQAFEKLNEMRSELSAVGYLNPGFGTVDDLSKEEFLNAINYCKPDILLLAMGAKKGQLWIQRNKRTVSANIISHLGATINFIAQTEKRAPSWISKSGFEWLWRILQKPSLWKRYSRDAVVMVRLFFFKWLPYAYYMRNNHRRLEENSVLKIERVSRPYGIILFFSGSLIRKHHMAIAQSFRDAATTCCDLIIDLKNVHVIDGYFLGMLLILLKHQRRNNKTLTVINMDRQIKRIFKSSCIERTLYV